MTVIISAMMCAKPAAPWKIIVFASEKLLEKHAAGIPWRPVSAFGGPISEHMGSAAREQMVVKSPKPMAGDITSSQETTLCPQAE